MVGNLLVRIWRGLRPGHWPELPYKRVLRVAPSRRGFHSSEGVLDYGGHETLELGTPPAPRSAARSNARAPA